MSYWDVAEMSQNGDLMMREAACYATEPNPTEDPVQWALKFGMLLAGQPGWAEAWASAVAGGVERPGKDAGVITDGQILSAVQSVKAADGGA